MTNVSIDEYEAMVDEYCRTNSSIHFGNRTAKHARHVVKTLFESAENNIKILSGKFCELFYSSDLVVNSSLTNAAKKLSSKPDSYIRIITCSPGEHIQQVKATINTINSTLDRCVIEYLPASYSGGVEELRHFLVVDDSKFRLEMPHAETLAFSPDMEIPSEVCMNDKKTSLQLSTDFDYLWNHLKG